jgi:hypothetical protein
MAETDPQSERRAKTAARLRELGMKGVLVQMAENGQLLGVRCEMPRCYCPKGRESFDKIGTKPDDWTPSEDHYPALKSKSGTRVPSNMRIGHKRCNNADYSRRKQIADMLDKGRSLDEIATTLTQKGIPRPHGTSAWTPAAVRKLLVT